MHVYGDEKKSTKSMESAAEGWYRQAPQGEGPPDREADRQEITNTARDDPYPVK